MTFKPNSILMENYYNKCLFLTSVTLSLLLFNCSVADAHPGRTDASGCHTCRTNCPSWGLSYGEYHCHRAKTLPQPEPPIKSHYNPLGEGYIESAPEYETSEENLTSASETNSVPPIQTSNIPTVGNIADNTQENSDWLAGFWFLPVVAGAYFFYRSKKRKNKAN